MLWLPHDWDQKTCSWLPLPSQANWKARISYKTDAIRPEDLTDDASPRSIMLALRSNIVWTLLLQSIQYGTM